MSFCGAGNSKARYQESEWDWPSGRPRILKPDQYLVFQPYPDQTSRLTELHLLDILPLCTMSLQTYYSVIGPWDLAMCFLASSFNTDQYTLGPRPWALWWSYSSPEFLIFGEIFFMTCGSWGVCPASLGTTFPTHRGGFPGATFGQLIEAGSDTLLTVNQSDFCSWELVIWIDGARGWDAYKQSHIDGSMKEKADEPKDSKMVAGQPTPEQALSLPVIPWVGLSCLIPGAVAGSLWPR